MIFATGAIGISVALFEPPAVFGLVVFAFGVLGCSFMVPYIAAVYSKKANKVGALAAMIAGGGTNFIWTLFELESATAMHPFFAGTIASILGILIFNRFGPTPSKQIVEYIEEAEEASYKLVPESIESDVSKMLAPEAKAVSQFMKRKQILAQ